MDEPSLKHLAYSLDKLREEQIEISKLRSAAEASSLALLRDIRYAAFVIAAVAVFSLILRLI